MLESHEMRWLLKLINCLSSAPAGEMPRWKIIDGNEAPITDITVIFRGDSVPEGFTKVHKKDNLLRLSIGLTYSMHLRSWNDLQVASEQI
ncbi:hypothetical protein GQ600_6497 [Phytophthora cactorum]|nr:hypothetical protein GQ600_6497 [Phytophthora cactorum]